MSNYLKNHSVSLKMMWDIKQKILSSQDIIDMTTVPNFVPKEAKLAFIRNTYGTAQLERQLSFTLFLNMVRKIFRELSENLPYANTVLYLATAMLGVGECGELNTTVFVNLVKQGRTDFCLLVLDNELPINNPYHEMHYICILGINRTRSLALDTMNDINQLPDECVAIDLLYSHVGHANTLMNDLRHRYQHYRLNHIHCVQVVEECVVKSILDIESKARKIMQESNIKSPFKKTNFLLHKPVLLFDLPSSLKQIPISMDTVQVSKGEVVNSSNDEETWPQKGILSAMPNRFFYRENSDALKDLKNYDIPLVKGL